MSQDDQTELDQIIASIAAKVEKLQKDKPPPVIGEIETGYGTSIDFETLARVMNNCRADYLHGDITDQVAAFEREVVAMELNPSPSDFYRVRYALDTIGVFARVFDYREWTRGREDLKPLFDLDSSDGSHE